MAKHKILKEWMNGNRDMILIFCFVWNIFEADELMTPKKHTDKSKCVKCEVYMNLHANGKIKRQNAWRSAKRLTRSEMLLVAAVVECMCACAPFVYLFIYERIHTQNKSIMFLWCGTILALWLIAFPSMRSQKNLITTGSTFWKINWSCSE